MKTAKLTVCTDGTENGSSVTDDQGNNLPVKSINIKIEAGELTVITLEVYPPNFSLNAFSMTAQFSKDKDETNPSPKL